MQSKYAYLKNLKKTDNYGQFMSQSVDATLDHSCVNTNFIVTLSHYQFFARLKTA